MNCLLQVLVHLHSFTYDYHLRAVQRHLASKPSNLRPTFHCVSFLEDFLKYYSKGPNFARNLVLAGGLETPSKAVSPVHLFQVLQNVTVRPCSVLCGSTCWPTVTSTG